MSDRLGGERTAIASFVVVGVAAAVLVVARTVPLAIGATVLLGIGIGVANAAVFGLVPKYVPEAVGGASGLVGGLGAFGGFVIPPVLGLFVDLQGTPGYTNGFVVVVLAVASVGLSGGLYRARAVPTPEKPVPADD